MQYISALLVAFTAVVLSAPTAKPKGSSVNSKPKGTSINSAPVGKSHPKQQLNRRWLGNFNNGGFGCNDCGFGCNDCGFGCNDCGFRCNDCDFGCGDFGLGGLGGVGLGRGFF